MGNIKSFLGADHKECDLLFADMENAVVAGDWESASALFAKMSVAFLRHFKMEEEVLFPKFEESSGMSCGPTQVMRMEHEQMKLAIEKLEAAIDSKDKDGTLGVCETFNMLVQQHNSKEEMILYTMADNILHNTSGEIITKMQEVA